MKMKMGGIGKFVGGFAVRMDEMLQEDWNKKRIKEQNPEEHQQWKIKKGWENAQRWIKTRRSYHRRQKKKKWSSVLNGTVTERTKRKLIGFSH